MYAVVNPATGETLREYPTLSDEGVGEAISSAHSAFSEWSRRVPVADRAALIARVAALHTERREELAVVEGGVRTADVHAVGPVTCYSLSIERLHAIGASHPNVMITILRNLVGILGSRLRVANEEIRSLE